jgi:hypothetical protein
MANICQNTFYFECEENYNEWVNKFQEFLGQFDGEVTWGTDYTDDDHPYNGEGAFEGEFESNWTFPWEDFQKLLTEDTPESDHVYFRCLSEEYGNHYVAMNIFSTNHWWDEQTFLL